MSTSQNFGNILPSSALHPCAKMATSRNPLLRKRLESGFRASNLICRNISSNSQKRNYMII